MSVADRYLKIRSHVDSLARDCGRDPKEITLVAVSKGHPWEQFAPAYQVGCRDFGENRLQEALQKIAEAPSDIRWHFIGTLQTKKVAQVVQKFSLIHSVDSFSLVEKISKTCSSLNRTAHILLQANTSGETTKHGLTEKEWIEIFPSLLKLPSIQIEGLMTMAPLTDDQQLIRSCFDNLRLLREKLLDLSHGDYPLPHLSMGMSHDYPLAIASGATILRIGTALVI